LVSPRLVSPRLASVALVVDVATVVALLRPSGTFVTQSTPATRREQHRGGQAFESERKQIQSTTFAMHMLFDFQPMHVFCRSRGFVDLV
jgi:hypothetical protein